MLLVISPLPCAASLTFRDISFVVAFCSSTAVAIVPEISLIWLITPLIEAIASTAAWVSRLDRFNLAADVFRGFRRFLGQFLHFIGDYGKAFARLARAGRFNGRVQASRLVCCAIEVMTLMT
jgi:hypothetical protein